MVAFYVVVFMVLSLLSPVIPVARVGGCPLSSSSRAGVAELGREPGLCPAQGSRPPGGSPSVCGALFLPVGGLVVWPPELQAPGQACWWVLRSSLVYFGFVWVEDIL